MRNVRDSEAISRAKQLRRDMSPPERAMWGILRAHRLGGWKFSRQVPVGPFIIDFASRRERLAIELDGDSHAERQAYDRRRTSYLDSQGWTVMRFTNIEMQSNPEGVAQMILERLEANTPSPRPSPQRGEGD